MKKLIAALLAAFALSAQANEPWTSTELKKPKYWDTYPTEATHTLAQACMKDFSRLSEEPRTLLCICIVYQLEDSVSYQYVLNNKQKMVKRMGDTIVPGCAKMVLE